ncbi:MAG: single-stranded-DNA-specific exonuclease RecJ [Anaerolineae bacterium]|nr:single-stranded-DNA-specific exonuclease RecJ [Anaerolineae bacterium]
MKTWIDPTPVDVPDSLLSVAGGERIVAERLARHGHRSADDARAFLDPSAYRPASSNELPDMDRAVARLQRAIARRERILVWGDFDVDGQTSTTLLVSALTDLGGQVAHHIPNRFSEGHGVHLPTLQALLDGGIDLLLTCDTGIAAHEAVAYARSRGVDVVITDHHTLPETLPDAEAVINPMRLPPEHPLRELPGVGVAYKLVEALYGARSSDHLLDLVAIGIVADVMVQVDDTRYLLQRGLEVVRNTTRPGLRAMIERAGIDPAYLTEQDIAFGLAPRLNALGRLADANPAVQLLTTDRPEIIVERVNELEGLNQKRRFLTRQVYAAAQQQIQDAPDLLKYAALVVSGAGWHAGVVGIVASRLVEDYGRPVIVLSEDGEHASGSARSVVGCNIVAAIRSQENLLDSYGGHTMAAGLRLPAEHVFAFRRGISQHVREQLGETDIEAQLPVDAFIELNDVDLAFAERIGQLAPFGNGNPPLTLATRSLQVKSRRTLGSRGDHLDLRLVDDQGTERRVIWWFGDLESVPQGRFDLAYTVRLNRFDGKLEPLIEWLDARPADDELTLRGRGAAAYEVVDYRAHADPKGALTRVQAEYPDVLVWRESIWDVEGVDRYELRPARTLVVWSPPPDPFVWESALETAQPETLIVFGNPAPFDQPQKLLNQVAGLLKYAASNKAGLVTISDIAALTQQTERTILACFHWLAANTRMRIVALADDSYQVEMGETAAQRGADPGRLQQLVDETRAYRAYWLRQTL